MFLERYILYTYSDVLNDSAPKSKKSILLHVPILMIVKLFLVNRHDKKTIHCYPTISIIYYLICRVYKLCLKMAAFYLKKFYSSLF